MKYVVISAVALSVIAATVTISLLEWIHEYHERSWARYRYRADRAFVEGDFKESETFYRAALLESQKLSSPVKELAAKIDLAEVLLQRQKYPESKVLLKQAMELVDSPTLMKEGDSSIKEKIEANRARALVGLARLEEIAAGKGAADRSSSAAKPRANTGYGALCWPDVVELFGQRRANRSATRWQDSLSPLIEKELLMAGDDPSRALELANALVDVSQFVQAQSVIEKTLRRLDRTKEVSDKFAASAYNLLAYCCYAEDRKAEAEKYVDLCIKHLKPDDEMYGLMMLHKAQIFAGEERAHSGLPICQEIAPLFVDTKSGFTWYYYKVLAECQLKSKKPLEAVQSLDSCLKSIGFSSSTPPQVYVNTYMALGEAYFAAGKIQEGRQAFRKSHEIWLDVTKQAGDFPSFIARYANRCRMNRRLQPAEELFKWAIEMRKNDSGPDATPRKARYWLYLADIYKNEGKYKESEDARARSESISRTSKSN